jgi:ferredoxin
MAIVINHDLCNGCGKCVKICPYEGVEIKDGKAYLNNRCTACGACIASCKEARTSKRGRYQISVTSKVYGYSLNKGMELSAGSPLNY